MKFCPKCGTRLEKISNFCVECGFRIKSHSSHNHSPRIHIPDTKINFEKKSSLGKNLGVAILVLFVLAAAFFIVPRLWAVGEVGGVQLMKPPTVEVNDVRVSGIDFSGINLGLVLDIYNPNEVSIVFDRADFDIYINDAKIGRGLLPNIVTIDSMSHSYPSTSMRVSYGGGLTGGWEYLKGALGGGGSTMKIVGTAYVKVPLLGDISIPFSHSESI